LFKLPAEIRNNIFKHALGGHEIRLNLTARNFTIQGSGNDDSSVTSNGFLNLTLVSRQVYTETALLPFTSNTFVFMHDSDTSQKGLAQILLPAQANSITTVKCRPGTVFFDASRGPIVSRHCLNTFADLRGLERLIIAVGDNGLSDESKTFLVEKLRKTHAKEKLDVIVSSEVLTW
jgi:hypothetical protein